MIDELAQWIALVAVLLLVLGLYRQLARYVGVPEGLGSLDALTGPPIGRRLPKAFLEQLKGATNGLRRPTVIAFVSEGCTGCARLLASVSKASYLQLLQVGERIDLVVVPDAHGEAFATALRGLSVPVMDVGDADWFTVLNVSASPFLVRVDERGTVVGKGVEHDIGSIIQDLIPQEA